MERQPCAINGIEFDALISESRSYNSDIPEYAVETGYSVSDNISIKPMEVELTGYLTNTPVTWLNHGTGRVETVVAQLENLFFSKQLVTLTTRTDVYTDMGITYLNVPKDESNMTSREVRVRLKKVNKVSSQMTSIPASYVRGGDTGANAGTSGTGSGRGGGSGGGSSGSGSGSSGSSGAETKASILYNLINK
ncbi:MAG: hypothetical protein HFI98_01785 [Lachnospiraceae bacterium]|nr:hypothetical protein [Lachnospiraceae bacterium]MCI9333484.1 hypothetical protein [Lachnospiraceae bacterium]